MAKITLKNTQTIEDAFEDFIFYKNTQGLTEKTIIYYRTTFQSISKHLDTTINISDLTKKDLQKMIADIPNYYSDHLQYKQTPSSHRFW